MNESGVKFQCEHIQRAIETFPGLGELIECRQELFARRWIGADENGISFGNISVRDDGTRRFFITGSATGAKAEIAVADCAHVTDYDFDRNWLRCEGLVIASSESLTHAAVYSSSRELRSVIHIHDFPLWRRTPGSVRSTGANVEYGTPAMAREVSRLIGNENGLLRMGGHAGGFIAFGRSVREAMRELASLADSSY